MDKIESHIGQAAEDKSGRGKSSKRSLRLEKQTIRTLTGAELQLAAGGICITTFGCRPLTDLKF